MKKIDSAYIGRQKARIMRGMSWFSPIFWAITIANLVLLNLRTFFEISLLVTIIVEIASLFGGIGFVWILGYFDVKKKIMAEEQKIYFAFLKDKEFLNSDDTM